MAQNSLGSLIEQQTDSAHGLNKRMVLFGTLDCADAARQIENFVARSLGARVVETVLAAMSSGGTFGLRLSDGRTVFLKIHAGELLPEHLKALHGTQEMLRGKGIPVARRVLPLTEFGNGRFASVHTFRARGDRLRAAHRGVIESAGAGLARLVSTALSTNLAAEIPDFLFRQSNPFSVRAPGIPEQPKLPEAGRARAVRANVLEAVKTSSGRSIVSHNDWSARNMLFWKGEVSSIFDFEALRRGPEPLLIGKAAITFINEPSGVPDPAGAAVRFIKAYEQAAGYEFSGADAASLDAGAALAVAQFCVSAVRSDGMTDEEAPQIFDVFMQRFRARLARDYKPMV